MRMRVIAEVFIVFVLASMGTAAESRSVSYTGNGSGDPDPRPTQIWGSCWDPDDYPGYVDVPWDICWGIAAGNIRHASKVEWCTYALSEHNAFFAVTNIDGGVGTLVFRRTFSGPVQLQFNGQRAGDGELFNATFGFSQGFYKGAEITFNFDADLFPDGTADGLGGIVNAISIHVGAFDYPPWVEAGNGAAEGTDTLMSPAQAHKCQDPGSARR